MDGLLFSLFNVYTWVIILRAMISWFNLPPGNPLVEVLVKLTEPVLAPLRALVPPEKLGGMDISPILAIVAIQIVKYLILNFNF